MKPRRLYIGKYYFDLFEYPDKKELNSVEPGVLGVCILKKHPKVKMGEIHLSLDQPVSIAVHELYHATQHLSRNVRRKLPYEYDENPGKPIKKEEWEALVMENLYSQLIR
jgi:hypothetical protein